MYHALLLEEDPDCLAAIERMVRSHGFTTRSVRTLEEARSELETARTELVVLDLDLGDGSGHEMIEPLTSGLEMEVLVVSGLDSARAAVRALKSGVTDYLTKPLDAQRLEHAVSGIKRSLELKTQLNEVRDDLHKLGRFERMVGSSAAMLEVYELITRVAPTCSTVLITGETGTGKEMVAQCVHQLSGRARKPFVAVNCGAVQAGLIESELFGHESGSFTGAVRSRRGLFEQADGGTLFLDEVTETPLDLQVKLLRALDTRSVQRVGGEKTIAVDVRVIAATNRSPEEAVRQGKLRGDLYYRLAVFPIAVPPLHERGRDVALLALAFLAELNRRAGTEKTFDPESLAKLQGFDWPGNVRQLRNVVERAFILAGERIQAHHVRFGFANPLCPRDAKFALEVGCTVAEAEQRLILATLDHVDGHKRNAAQMLGISLKTLYNRMNSYGLGRRSMRAPDSARRSSR
jgi:DNA-binding NtrC family response regulator